MRDMTKRVRTSSLEVAYEDRGSPQAEPTILVHGFPDDVRTWDGVVAPLVDSGYRTLTPYLRGFGPTRFLEKTAFRSGQLAALGQDLIEFADAVGIERFTLVGHDWGGRAAYIAAALWPERVQGLVALSVGYGTSTPKDQISYDQARAYWYQWYFGLRAYRSTRGWVRRATSRRSRGKRGSQRRRSYGLGTCSDARSPVAVVSIRKRSDQTLIGRQRKTSNRSTTVASAAIPIAIPPMSPRCPAR